MATALFSPPPDIGNSNSHYDTTADKSPVILAGMPVSSHMDVKLQSDGNAKSSAYTLSKLPSMALDFGIPAKMTAHSAIMRVAALAIGFRFGPILCFNVALASFSRLYSISISGYDREVESNTRNDRLAEVPIGQALSTYKYPSHND